MLAFNHNHSFPDGFSFARKHHGHLCKGNRIVALVFAWYESGALKWPVSFRFFVLSPRAYTMGIANHLFSALACSLSDSVRFPFVSCGSGTFKEH